MMHSLFAARWFGTFGTIRTIRVQYVARRFGTVRTSTIRVWYVRYVPYVSYTSKRFGTRIFPTLICCWWF
ncbi:hypothetical protein KP509_06G040500 [Ceratopteris richardii]|uniref:Uncharacterized protein n=1 Tax=Ceratopteris richardii TaxID=49495 RepID=A0A8T2UFA8_CERRI|nr:hypothetical protein KP509_06G040500 [Ceratopteris richardii]